eukprot:1045414-Amphidinium_carterae.1
MLLSRRPHIGSVSVSCCSSSGGSSTYKSHCALPYKRARLMSQRANFSGLPFGDTPSDMHKLQLLHSVLIASSGGIELKKALRPSAALLGAWPSSLLGTPVVTGSWVTWVWSRRLCPCPPTWATSWTTASEAGLLTRAF